MEVEQLEDDSNLEDEGVGAEDAGPVNLARRFVVHDDDDEDDKNGWRRRMM